MKRIPMWAVHLSGVAAFALPFILNRPPDPALEARAEDAPWMLAALMPLIIALALYESTRGRLSAKALSLLGMLCGLSAVMRIPISVAGANLMFFLPIVAGFVFGARFGFILGALAMAASAFITGGVGPWLPFQMWAMGWTAAGAALLKPAGELLAKRPVASSLLLSVYGFCAAFFFGFVINLYFWPVAFQGDTAISWSPELTVWQSLEHYGRFYLLTSAAWDAAGGVANVLVISLLGAPVVELFRRYKKRFVFELGA